jgi:phage shock protein A
VAISIARQKIESLKAGLSDLKMKRAMAEITEMASGMVTGLGSSGDTLNRLEEMVSEERHKAAGRVRVAVDSLDLKDIHIKEAEQSALAEQALAAFESSQPPPQLHGATNDALASRPRPEAALDKQRGF